MDGHLAPRGEQNPAYRPTHRPSACDQGFQPSDAAPDRGQTAGPSIESTASRVRSSESGHEWA